MDCQFFINFLNSTSCSFLGFFFHSSFVTLPLRNYPNQEGRWSQEWDCHIFLLTALLRCLVSYACYAREEKAINFPVLDGMLHSIFWMRTSVLPDLKPQAQQVLTFPVSDFVWVVVTLELVRGVSAGTSSTRGSSWETLAVASAAQWCLQ